jgi:hypothetical protein
MTLSIQDVVEMSRIDFDDLSKPAQRGLFDVLARAPWAPTNVSLLHMS